VMYGDEDDDEVWGEGEPDVLFGGVGNDLVMGGVGADIMFGDDGIVAKLDKTNPAADIRVGIGNPALITAAMRDAADDVAGSLDLILTDPVALDGNDYMSGDAGGDVMLGGGGDDLMGGDVDPRLALANTPQITTESGRDILIGDGGIIQFDNRRLQRVASVVDDDPASFRDTIYGDNGNDVIIGGQGADSGSFMLGTREVTRVLAGGHGTGRGDTDLEVTDDDIIIGDNGELLYANDSIADNYGRLERIRTTDLSDLTGGADTAAGELGDDIILGGVNDNGIDVLEGSAGNDVILGDDGELDFALDLATDLDTLDLIRSYRDGLGGTDEISGNAGDDVLIGGTGGDSMFGDGLALSGLEDGGDVMLGDNADIFLVGNTGRLKVRVADMPAGTAIDLITTTDDAVSGEDKGGADTMSGNAGADIIIGGVNNGGQDILYGDRASPTLSSISHDGHDILLGDNGLLDFTFEDLAEDRTVLDLIRSFEDGMGAVDVISGNKGADVAIGGSAGDHIYGDDETASATGQDGGDMLLGDNADIFLVGAGLASGGDLKLVLDAAVRVIRTTDEEHPEYGGADTISGNAKGDIIAGGVQGDTLFGDRASPNVATAADEGNDILLGDNGAFEWLSNGRLGEISGIDIAANNAPLWAKYGAGAADGNLTTLDLITTEQPTNGGRDTIFGDEGDDLVFGGTDADMIHGDDGDEVANGAKANRDVLLGDHGRLYPQFSALNGFNSRNFFAIDVGDGGGGEGDRIRGEEGDDVLLGQQGDDRMWGGSGDDDMTGGHNVSGGFDELGAPSVSAILDLPMNDLMDGGSGDDAMAGDNAIIWRRADDVSPRFRELTAAAIYSTTNSIITANIGAVAQSDPDDAVGRDIELIDHSDAVEANPLGRFGADVMAGGAESDTLWGELGNDIMQGDGIIGADDANPASITRSIDVMDVGSNPDTDQTLYFNIPESVTDADDYMEGNGGSDLMYGGLGQDDMIGGSSALFGLTSNEERPDGSDFMFGGAGSDIARNHAGDAIEDAATHEITTGAGGHARDADYIMGDNANVFRLTTTGDAFRTFVYDNYAGDLRIVPRAMQQLDYTLGGADWAGGAYSNGAANADNGAADLIYGESGDDTLFGMAGSDVLFGDGQDDDIVGGYGHDWISGGTGQDGVLGDDGLIRTSRNNSTVGEPLNSVAALLATDPDTRFSNGNVINELISTPGGIQTATINKAGDLKKTADLVPFSYDPLWTASDDEFPNNQDGTPFADDIIFGGLGSDFLHGGSGDDAISGAEALNHAYVPVYDAAGNPTGVLDLGYLAVGIPGAVNPGDIAAFNPVDLDGRHLNNRFRAGEFALYDEYDPLRKILLTATGGLSKSGAGLEFLLNFDQDEGMVRAGGTVPGATGQQTTSYGAVRDDGTDVLFGDLGNDWLVGGTGRDNMYGGWGNDLINADDDLTTLGDAPKHGDPNVAGANDRPDTHPFYEDRGYGGAGRDVLIANTGGDRLIDWVGEYNSYLVPFAPYGMATVSRTLQPQLAEFLLALSKSDGADPTRPADTGADPLRNGEPDGELGMVRQRDLAWQDQTGAPSDPQAGNIPGGPRDVLRSAGFNEGTMDGFFIDSGKFAVSGNSLQVAADSTYGDAVSVYHVGDMLPAYFEVQASVEIVKATGGWKGNSYIIFDYASTTDFKFAGIDQSSNKLVIGHKASWGWAVDKQVPFQAKADTVYNILLAVNGLNATVIVNNQKSVTHTFQPRIADGVSNGLNYGMVGVGSDSSRGKFDNIRVQVLPPQTTFTSTETFADGIADQVPLSRETGTWTFGSGRYLGLPAAGGTLATSLIDLGVDSLNASSLLELTGTVSTPARAGFIFDRYSATDFKFVAIDAASDQVIIGHHTTRGGWSTDAFVSRQIDAGIDYKLGVSIKGTTVSVTLGGQAVVGHAFNAVAVDGGFGLLASGGQGSFDSVTVRTNDPAFAHAGGSALVAAAESIAPIEARAALTQAELDSVARFAIAEWTETLGDGDPRLASLGDVRLVVQDLDGGELGYSEQGLLVVDVDGAGHGWFVDASPASSEEFRVRLDRNIVAAAPSSEAAASMDLVTVVGHELGHLLGLSHDDAARYAIMGSDLSAGERHLIGDAQAFNEPAAVAGDLGAHVARLVVEEEAWRGHQKAAMAGRIGNPGSDGAAAVGSTGAAMTFSAVDWQGNLQGSSWMPFSAFGAQNFRGNGAFLPDFAEKSGTKDEAEAGSFDPLGEALLGGVEAGMSHPKKSDSWIR
jgi:Ca2+-binding RTX toxin-like protein